MAVPQIPDSLLSLSFSLSFPSSPPPHVPSKCHYPGVLKIGHELRFALTSSSSLFLTCPPVAALSFLVWDVLITLDQEVDAIWSSVLFFFSGVAFSHLSLRRTNSSYSKWLFFFVRYFAVAMQMYFYSPYFILFVDHSPHPFQIFALRRH